MPLSSIGLTTISADECRALLGTALIGRVLVSVDALPAALPVNYRVIDDDIVFRAAPGNKLSAASHHTVLGFEVDEFDCATRSGWSVLVVGLSRVVTEPAEIAALDQARLESWWLPAPSHYVKLQMQRISGRRLQQPVP